jgi:hypothetical protein
MSYTLKIHVKESKEFCIRMTIFKLLKNYIYDLEKGIMLSKSVYMHPTQV